ncbi:DUF2637 domain-containing protein [Nocardiopsis suaedae]|uniref:DUF2637 domain-containing protein n=1 Tax=Nocardiopsis suaedae TaxID=3018444 RepID=A0ABT4TM48_9ACTN|nr:DUF2637 domain-containing protein [Nocardiopsis suaedae]MDA2805681.1 DUF2637 domain-containing protein [Nocardiopsis suaedae]
MTTLPKGRAPFPLPAAAGLGIAAGLAVVSYRHAYAFALKAGATFYEALIIAATVDGVIVMCLATIALARRYGQAPPKVAKIGLLLGIIATGGANLVYGLTHVWVGVAVAIWVPLVAEVAYLVAMAALRITQAAAAAAEERPVVCGRSVPVEAVMARVRAAEEAGAGAGAEESLATAPPVVSAPRPVICGAVVPVAAVVAGVRRPAAARPVAPRRQEEPVAEVSDRLSAGAAAARAALPADVAERLGALPGLDERDRAVAALVAADRVATGAEVAALTGSSERTGRRVLRRVTAALELAGARPAPAAERPVAAYQGALVAAVT